MHIHNVFKVVWGKFSPTKVSTIMEQFAEKCTNVIRLREAKKRDSPTRSRSRTPPPPRENEQGELPEKDGETSH